jgi:peroxiredoxin
MSKQLTVGHKAPAITGKNIHGKYVIVPNPNGRITHLQFRRFAGCSICNLHLQTFVRRHEELLANGVVEVVVFHSTEDELMPFQGYFPFDVIGDPTKKYYKTFAVGGGLSAILNPTALAAMFNGMRAKEKPAPKMPKNGGILGLPADFLIGPDGCVIGCHYGTHAYDQWPVEKVLQLATAAPVAHQRH